MKDGLNPFTENQIRLAAFERCRQLEELSDNLNVLEKQLELNELADQIILRANAAPKGLVEIVFAKKKVNKDTSIEKILLNMYSKLSAFNVSNPEDLNSKFRTVIVVDSMWTDNLLIYQSEYGLPVSYLKRI